MGIRSLMEERDELLKELNALRALVGPPTEVRSVRPIDKEVLKLLKHENEFTDYHTTTTTAFQAPSEDSCHADTDTGGSSKDSPTTKVSDGTQATDMPPASVGNESVFVDGLPVTFGSWGGLDNVQPLPSGLSAPNYSGDAVSINQQTPDTQQILPMPPNDFTPVHGSTIPQLPCPPIDETAPLTDLSTSQFITSPGSVSVFDSYFGHPASNHVLLY